MKRRWKEEEKDRKGLKGKACQNKGIGEKGEARSNDEGKVRRTGKNKVRTVHIILEHTHHHPYPHHTLPPPSPPLPFTATPTAALDAEG